MKKTLKNNNFKVTFLKGLNIPSEYISKFDVEERGIENGIANFNIKIFEEENIKDAIDYLKSFIPTFTKKILNQPEKLIDFKIEYLNENNYINSSFEFYDYYLDKVSFDIKGDITSTEDLNLCIILKKYKNK